MRYSNKELAKQYISSNILSCIDNTKRYIEIFNNNKTMSQYDNKLYSYNYLAAYYKPGQVYINALKSTPTTQRHKGLIRRQAESYGLEVRYFNYIKGILTDNETGEVIAGI